MREVLANEQVIIPLGRQGENNAVEVLFPIDGWSELYGNGAYEVLNQRPSEDTPYTCSITVDTEYVRWVIQAADVALVGHGQCELTYVVGGTIAKSIRYSTCVQKSVEGAGTVPAPYESRIEDLIEASANITVVSQEAVAAVEAKKVESVAAVQGEGNTQVGNVQSAGTTQVGNVNSAGTEKVNAVNSAGSTQVAAVNSAGATQKQAVEIAGAEQIRLATAQATAAAASATSAGNSKLDAEAWAKGTRNGEPVPSTDPAYNNSAKHYAEQAATYDIATEAEILAALYS